MARKKGGIIKRLLIGSEKSEGYARSTLPSNRWGLFWDIFKGRFSKLIFINLLILIFFLPMLGLMLFHGMYMTVSISNAPFSQCFGVGYQTIPSLIGVQEGIKLSADITVYMMLPITAIIAAAGIAGGAYVIRNMVWTEGIFVVNDFWRGIKKNIKQILVISIIYSILIFLTIFATSLYDERFASGNCEYWVVVLVKCVLYLFLALYSMITLHMITMSVTYELKFFALFRNAFIFTIGLLPQNIFFIFLGIIPVIITMLGAMFSLIGYILLLLFGFSLFLLVWTNYSHWVYDIFINDRIPGAQKNRGIYEKIKNNDSKAIQQYSQQVAMATHCSLNNRPIKPITDEELQLAELSSTYSRKDIEKLNESRRVIYEDYERYVEEHKNDPEFLPTEEELALKKQEDKRIAKAKKVLEKHKKNR